MLSVGAAGHAWNLKVRDLLLSGSAVMPADDVRNLQRKVRDLLLSGSVGFHPGQGARLVSEATELMSMLRAGNIARDIPPNGPLGKLIFILDEKQKLVFHKVAMPTLQTILRHKVIELLIEVVIQVKFCAKFQTIVRGQLRISLNPILWDQWGSHLDLRKRDDTPPPGAI
jgi:hypothetical protein